jgi:hypothetical protein
MLSGTYCGSTIGLKVQEKRKKPRTLPGIQTPIAQLAVCHYDDYAIWRRRQNKNNGVTERDNDDNNNNRDFT